MTRVKKIVECVPNISEGRDQETISRIAGVVERRGVKLLDVSSDAHHNRTVITFAGAPEAVVGAAYRLTFKARQLIDMSGHKGAHPRMGAVDVCPFIPIAGVSMDECVQLANWLGRSLWARGLSGYYYGFAAVSKERQSLSYIRRGEYEALPEKLKQREWTPDFGSSHFNRKFGAMVIGARKPLIAYNVNLRSMSLDLADGIARILRGSGGISDIQGVKRRISGVFTGLQAIKIDMRERKFVQVSMNLTDYQTTPILCIFETIQRIAALCQTAIHSSEIVGMVPRDALTDVPITYLQLKNFNPQKQIIEEALGL